MYEYSDWRKELFEGREDLQEIIGQLIGAYYGPKIVNKAGSLAKKAAGKAGELAKKYAKRQTRAAALKGARKIGYQK